MRESAGGVVVGPTGKIVLVNQGSDVWSFPKGGVEAGEEPLAAAKREIEEECGITELEFISAFEAYSRYRIGKGGVGEDFASGETKRMLFLFRTGQTEFVVDDHEIVGARWVTLDEALTMLTHPKDKAFLEKNRVTIEACSM